MLIGYARVSSVGQSLDVQIEAPTAARCGKIYSEKRSGRTSRDRPELARSLDRLRLGDQLVITRLDRLARSVGNLHAPVEQINAAGATAFGTGIITALLSSVMNNMPTVLIGALSIDATHATGAVNDAMI